MRFKTFICVILVQSWVSYASEQKTKLEKTGTTHTFTVQPYIAGLQWHCHGEVSYDGQARSEKYSGSMQCTGISTGNFGDTRHIYFPSDDAQALFEEIEYIN